MNESKFGKCVMLVRCDTALVVTIELVTPPPCCTVHRLRTKRKTIGASPTHLTQPQVRT